MDTNIFKSKFEAAVNSAKKSKTSGTQVLAKIYMKSGQMHQFSQSEGSWWKYEIDTDAGTLQIGNRSNSDTPQEVYDLQYKSVRIMDIAEISGFDVDYMTAPEISKTTTT